MGHDKSRKKSPLSCSTLAKLALLMWTTYWKKFAHFESQNLGVVSRITNEGRGDELLCKIRLSMEVLSTHKLLCFPCRICSKIVRKSPHRFGNLKLGMIKEDCIIQDGQKHDLTRLFHLRGKQ